MVERKNLIVMVSDEERGQLKKLVEDYGVSSMSEMVRIMVAHFSATKPEVTRTIAPKASALPAAA